MVAVAAVAPRGTALTIFGDRLEPTEELEDSTYAIVDPAYVTVSHHSCDAEGGLPLLPRCNLREPVCPHLSALRVYGCSTPGQSRVGNPWPADR